SSTMTCRRANRSTTTRTSKVCRSCRTSESNLRRSDLLVLAGLAGCMRIYPDPELPDLTVEWDEFECMDATADIAITVTGVDTPTTMLMQTAAWRQLHSCI